MTEIFNPQKIASRAIEHVFLGHAFTSNACHFRHRSYVTIYCNFYEHISIYKLKDCGDSQPLVFIPSRYIEFRLHDRVHDI